MATDEPETKPSRRRKRAKEREVPATVAVDANVPVAAEAKRAVETKAQEVLDARAERFTERDIEELLGREKEVARKVEEVPRAFERLVNQVKLFFEMLRDYWSREYRRIPWYTITMVGAALLYFLDPFDLVPDYIPGIGHVDDALVFALAVRAIKEDLRRYCLHKGYDSARYFK